MKDQMLSLVEPKAPLHANVKMPLNMVLHVTKHVQHPNPKLKQIKLDVLAKEPMLVLNSIPTIAQPVQPIIILKIHVTNYVTTLKKQQKPNFL